MYLVRVETDFSAGHHLSHYHGKCERPHGHNYKVRVWARGEQLGEGGMLVDFGILKSALRKIVNEDLDHRDLNEIAAFQDDPSAERIARYIFEEIRRVDPSLPLHAVEVFETDTSMARYEE